MRTELLYSPRLLLERLALASIRGRRLAELKGTPAAVLSLGHIDSLELLKLARETGVRVIYDVGANVGTWSLLANALVPHACVHAFEPLSDHLVGFRENLKGVDDVTLHPIALGLDNLLETLHVTSFSDASSILPPNGLSKAHFGVTEVKQVQVPVRRLDDYRRSENLPWPDLIKLDIQGYELEALRGASECLNAAKAVISEVSFVPYYEGQCLFHEVAVHLANAGLLVTAFGFSTPAGRTLGQTDVLFTRLPVG